MRVTILEPRLSLYDGNAQEVVLPSEDGELCVLDFHQPFLCALCPGSIKIGNPKTGEEKRIFISRGVARMRANELSIMVETLKDV